MSTGCEAPKRARVNKDFLKVDLHTHTADDPEEHIPHTSCELIDRAHCLGFDALSITNHNDVSSSEYLRDYADERGIILVPGVEIDICGKHVLVLNADRSILEARTFNDLRRLRREEHLVVAPHPYFPDLTSLLWRLGRNVDVFDAIEFSWFYHSWINFNSFAMRSAEKHGLPLISTSDCHRLEKLGSAYSIVDAEKSTEAIIDAVRRGRVEIVAHPIRLLELGKHGLEHIFDVTLGRIGNSRAGG